MSDYYKPVVQYDETDPDAKRRLAAIFIACLVTFSLIAGSVAFATKRYYDNKRLAELEAKKYQVNHGSSDDEQNTQQFTVNFEKDLNDDLKENLDKGNKPADEKGSKKTDKPKSKSKGSGKKK